MTLLAELTPEQQKDWDQNGGFNVRGSDDRMYRILRHTQYNNNILGKSTRDGRDPEAFYLLGYYPLPTSERILIRTDAALMQKVLLECDAPRVARGACCEEARWYEIRRMEEIGDYNGKI